MNARQVLLLFLLALVFFLLMVMPSPFEGQTRTIDLAGKWSSSYLLAQGQSFTDREHLIQVGRGLAGWRADWDLESLEPPWLAALLLPLALVSFQRAVWLFLLLSILLLYLSAIVLWTDGAKSTGALKGLWAGLLTAFAFVPSLVTLSSGQVVILVLAGLAGFMFLESKRRGLAAGAALSLTLIKPHLLYLTLPVLLLDCVRRRQWGVIGGLTGALAGLTAIAFALRPTFVFEYARSMGGASIWEWQVPSLPGAVAVAFGLPWLRLVGLALLPVLIWMWFRDGARWDRRTTLDVTVLLSLLMAPYVWSYDFILLLLPVTRMVRWVFEGAVGRVDRVVLILALAGTNAILLLSRFLITNEVLYFWVTPVIGLLYAWSLTRVPQVGLMPLRWRGWRAEAKTT